MLTDLQRDLLKRIDSLSLQLQQTDSGVIHELNKLSIYRDEIDEPQGEA